LAISADARGPGGGGGGFHMGGGGGFHAGGGFAGFGRPMMHSAPIVRSFSGVHSVPRFASPRTHERACDHPAPRDNARQHRAGGHYAHQSGRPSGPRRWPRLGLAQQSRVAAQRRQPSPDKRHLPWPVRRAELA
jgi:hypothetical protein